MASNVPLCYQSQGLLQYRPLRNNYSKYSSFSSLLVLVALFLLSSISARDPHAPRPKSSGGFQGVVVTWSCMVWRSAGVTQPPKGGRTLIPHQTCKTRVSLLFALSHL
jgi:hypothetical protein